MNDIKTFGQKILDFLFSLDMVTGLPEGIVVMNPFSDKETRQVCEQFYLRYYNDQITRRMIIGINPGRFGAGTTGIPFTDPVRLEDVCGIRNTFDRKQELSSVFIYKMIQAFGGVQKFYSRFYITSVSPLGFMSNGKNLNYYDHKKLQEALLPFMVKTLKKQIEFGIETDVAFCLGEGKNFKFLNSLNRDQALFKKIIPLSHPRFIMQYRYKKQEEYIDQYLGVLKK